MRLVTLQDKYVIEQLSISNIYECKISNVNDREIVLYNRMRDIMISTLKLPQERQFFPIWCWVMPRDQELDDVYMEELYSRKPPSCDRICYIEMDVPKEFVLISNFNLWDEMLFDVAFFKKRILDEDFDKLFEKQKGATLQACIPFISKEHIKKVIDLNNYKDRDYSHTENIIETQIKKGEISLDPTGQFIEKYNE